MSVSKVMPHVPRPSECVFYEFMLEQGCSGEHTIMMMNRLLLCLLFLVMPTIGLTAAFHKKRILETAHPSLRFASLNLHLGADFNTLFYPSNADQMIHQAVSKFWDFIQVSLFDFTSSRLGCLTDLSSIQVCACCGRGSLILAGPFKFS